MKKFLLVLMLSAFALAQTTPAAKPAAKSTKKMSMKMAKPAMTSMMPDDIKWSAAPDSLPAGTQIAVLSGNPMKPGPFVIRLKTAAGEKIAPHWHPTSENITVISGEFLVGTGDKYDESIAKSYPAGSFLSMPAHMHHFAGAKGDTVVQVESNGPFVIHYVNPSDDPRKPAAAKGKAARKPAAKKMGHMASTHK